MSGRLIVFEGLDRVGKSTQSRMLIDRLLKDGVDVSRIAYPSEITSAGQEARFTLQGAASYSNADLTCLFHADRLLTWDLLRDGLEGGETIIVDRAWRSGVVYASVRARKYMDETAYLQTLEYAMWFSKHEELIYLVDPWEGPPLGEAVEANDVDEYVTQYGGIAYAKLENRMPPKWKLQLDVREPDGTPVKKEALHGTIHRWVMEGYR